MASGSTKAVYSAIAANSFVAVAKFGAFLFTGSGAMLSEAIHSVADVGNQSLLAVGIHRSKAAPDEEHPYGYERAQFTWALISAVGIFFLGCGVTLAHGIHSAMHPEPPGELGLAFVILAVSGVVEGWSYWMAHKAVRDSARESGMSFMEYVRDGPDPMGVAVLIEDSAAVLGIVIAAVALFVADLTGNGLYDALGSIVVGLLLGALAIFLVRKNKKLLMDRAMEPEARRELVELIANDPAVEGIDDVKATILGASSARFKAEVDFDGREVARRALDELDLDEVWAGIHSKEELQDWLIDFGETVLDQLDVEEQRIEDRMREAQPGLKHIDLEADE
jgi:zinc transporter 9